MKQALLPFLVFFGFTLSAQDTLPADTLQEETKHKHKNTHYSNDEHRLSVGLNLSVGYSFRKIESRKYSELIHCREEHETGILTPNAGLSVAYRLNKNFQLVSGISYFQTGFDFSEDVQLSDTLENEFLIGCEVYNVVDPKIGYVQNNFYDPRFAYYISGYHPSQGTLNIKVRYHYLDVPLMVRFNMGQKRFRAYVAAGASANFMVSYDETIKVKNEGTTFSSYRDEDKGLFFVFNRWNFSALGCAGVSYRVNQSFSIGAEFSGRYQLRNIFTKESQGNADWYVEHHYSATAGVSVWYYW
ncbi:MAG TPA: outer membrane beta-barrel protein [Bacteroidia bacterium]|nr:outer membrane beta-barrel protein [Bacteroidia bacterium]